MKEMLQIEQACASNDHDTVMSVLDSIDSFDIKKQAFLKIVEYHEEQSRFPVGYMFLFMKWLLQNNDRKTAMKYILKCRENGIDEGRISHLIYETVIKPDEPLYKENFNKNLRLLQQHKILISDQVFAFEQIKEQVLIIASCQPLIPEFLIKEVVENDKNPLMINITDMKALIKIVDNIDFVHLVYDDMQQLYYMLLFEDFTGLSEYMKQKKIIVFDGTDERHLKGFLLNLSVRIPGIVFGMTHVDKYNEIIEKAKRSRIDEFISISKSINTFYKDYDDQYYRDLFVKDPSEIKILLATSEETELNKFITKNWYEAFCELGYNARLLIEKGPLEKVTNHYINGVIHEFNPDLVFAINWSVSLFLKEGEAQENLMWIMRYRDSALNVLNHAKPGYEYNNMFILPILFEWTEKLKDIGIPENRIFNTSDGVNINLITKKNEMNRSYACDIVSVNNAVGNESFRLDYYFKTIKNEHFEGIILEEVERLKESFEYEKLLFSTYSYNNIIENICGKLLNVNCKLSGDGEKHLKNLFAHIIESLCRGRIMEWIVDSGITSNIKLWGKGWSNIDKFKNFHEGVAMHGDELATIYRNSNISVSDSLWELHERNFEIFASGGFPLIRHVEVPPVESMNKITQYFKENKDVVLFSSKDDLLNKIQYYLDNPEERERIAENGRQVVLNNFSHIAIARKTMDFIKDYYKD